MKINLPTKITILRILLLPLMIVAYCLSSFSVYTYIAVAAIFVIAAATDYLDGYLARKNNQVTDLGKFLDPIADKLLVVAAILMLLENGVLPLYLGLTFSFIIIGREFIIGVFRQIAASKGVVLAADKWGKIKTFVTLAAMPPLLLYPIVEGMVVGTVFWWIGMVEFAIGTLFTVISGINYVLINKNVLKGEDNE